MNVKEKLVGLLLSIPTKEVLVIGKRGGRAFVTASFIADHLISNGVTVQEWVSVKDRLPTREDANESESILAINIHEGYVGRWIWDIVSDYPAEFTHWMPLPEPPKEGRQ